MFSIEHLANVVAELVNTGKLKVLPVRVLGIKLS